MTRETPQNDRPYIPVEMAPWRSKSENVAKYPIFQKLTVTPKIAQKSKIGHFSQSPGTPIYLTPVSGPVYTIFLGVTIIFDGADNAKYAPLWPAVGVAGLWSLYVLVPYKEKLQTWIG